MRLNSVRGMFAKGGLLALVAITIAMAQQRPIRVLFWGGGVTAHNPTALRDTLAPLVGAQGMTLAYRRDSNSVAPVWLHADTLAQYDVLLVYTSNQNAAAMTQTQFNALKQWVENGHVIVALHGSTNTYLNGNTTIATSWRQLLGAQFVDHGPAGGTGNGGAPQFLQPNHPALSGATNLPASAASSGGSPYWDEGRTHNQFMSDTIVLARSFYTSPSATSRPWIWVRPQGKGWVYYNASGHDGQVWRRPEYQSQVFTALKWGACFGDSILCPATPIRMADLARSGRGEIQTQGGNIILPPLQSAHSLQITDMSGRTVFSLRQSRAQRYDVSHLPAGVYHVEVLTADKETLRGLYTGQ